MLGKLYRFYASLDKLGECLQVLIMMRVSVSRAPVTPVETHDFGIIFFAILRQHI